MLIIQFFWINTCATINVYFLYGIFYTAFTQYALTFKISIFPKVCSDHLIRFCTIFKQYNVPYIMLKELHVRIHITPSMQQNLVSSNSLFQSNHVEALSPFNIQTQTQVRIFLRAILSRLALLRVVEEIVFGS